MPGDAFGQIYEYFLNKFAMSGAQDGGEFFTPPSLVKTIVNTRGMVIVGESGIKIPNNASFLINVEYLILNCS